MLGELGAIEGSGLDFWEEDNIRHGEVDFHAEGGLEGENGY